MVHCSLRHNAPAIAKESGDGKWETLISNLFDISFGRFEESRCDDRVMVSEVSFHKNSQEKKIQMKIVYDQFTVSPQLTKTINDQVSGLPIMERAKSVMSLMAPHMCVVVSWHQKAAKPWSFTK